MPLFIVWQVVPVGDNNVDVERKSAGDAFNEAYLFLHTKYDREQTLTDPI